MRQIRYFIRLLQAFLGKFKKLLFASIFLGILFFVLFPSARDLFPALRGTSAIGLVGRFSVDNLPPMILSQISAGLTKLDSTNNVLPGLALSWESSEEGRVWVFKLREGKWQDGKKIKAADINYNFSDVTREVVDDQTVKFILKDPFAPFPSVVTRPLFKRGLLGTGDWKVDKITFISGNYVQTLKMTNIISNQKKVYKFFPSEETARIAFKLGEVSSLVDLVDPKELVSWKGVEITEHTRPDRYVGVFLNNEDGLLVDKSIRQALAYAIDKEAFGKERAISPMSPDSWAFNSQVKPYTYSVEHAKELINSALPKDQRDKLVVTLATTPSLLPIADKIKAYWEAVGVKTDVQVTSAIPQNFKALLAIQEIPPDPDQYSLWHSTQTATNITNYRKTKESQRIDKLLEDGRKTLDQDERKKIYLDFQRFLVEDSPVIFLFHPSTYTITRK
ncbi:MAG: ABC transporter substrate-binding protein [bacterium]|nr:ABC transporter substrate-binding protein [bacterium]